MDIPLFVTGRSKTILHRFRALLRVQAKGADISREADYNAQVLMAFKEA